MGYRILSLDGGGAWALIEVRALIDLYGEAACGHAVLRSFDLVAANSGGSIVLGGLLEDMTLAQIHDLSWTTTSATRSSRAPAACSTGSFTAPSPSDPVTIRGPSSRPCSG